MSLFAVNRADPTPLYYRLEIILREAIDSGEYRTGERLPTERELEESYGVSRITVRKALESLEREGLVRRDRGRRGGTFVLNRQGQRTTRSPCFLDRIATKQVHVVETLAFDIRPCDPEIARILGLRSKDSIRFIERIFSTTDGPVVHARNYLPIHVGEKLQREDLEARFLRDVIADKSGVAVAEVQDEVEASLADSHIAMLLKIRAGSPILRMNRLFLGKDGSHVNLSILRMTSNYRVAITLPYQIVT